MSCRVVEGVVATTASEIVSAALPFGVVIDLLSAGQSHMVLTWGEKKEDDKK